MIFDDNINHLSQTDTSKRHVDSTHASQREDTKFALSLLHRQLGVLRAQCLAVRVLGLRMAPIVAAIRLNARFELRIRDVDPESFVELVERAPDPAELAADRDAAAQVAEAIDELKTPYREVLSLRLVHDLSPAEIARSLGRPVGPG